MHADMDYVFLRVLKASDNSSKVSIFTFVNSLPGITISCVSTVTLSFGNRYQADAEKKLITHPFLMIRTMFFLVFRG